MLYMFPALTRPFQITMVTHIDVLLVIYQEASYSTDHTTSPYPEICVS